MANDICSTDGCDRPLTSKGAQGLCPLHYKRFRRLGSVELPERVRMNQLPCSIEGCSSRARKRGWCASHYSQWQRLGEVRPFGYKWAERGDCKVCGKPCKQRGRREFCSAACVQFWRRNQGNLPPHPSCVRCGIEIDLSPEANNGRRKKTDTKLCRRCRVHHRTQASPGELAERDGAFCQICGCDVDLTARHPDPMRPSVDHIVPKASGGSDAAENNQLTHLWCNQVKSDRAGFTLLPT